MSEHESHIQNETEIDPYYEALSLSAKFVGSITTIMVAVVGNVESVDTVAGGHLDNYSIAGIGIVATAYLSRSDLLKHAAEGFERVVHAFTPATTDE